MSSSSKAEIATVTERENAHFLYGFASSAAYITLAIGYLLSILQASQLTVLNFVGFTVFQIVYVALLWSLVKSGISALPMSRRLATLYLIGLSILTIICELFGATGLNFDWLLYLVTLSLYFLDLPLRTAIIAGILVICGHRRQSCFSG